MYIYKGILHYVDQHVLRLVGKLNYLIITKPDITFIISMVSQFLNANCDSHLDVVKFILQFIKNTLGRGLLHEDKGNAKIIHYSDVDWERSPLDTRST